MAFLEQVEPLLGDDPLATEAILGRVGAIPGEMAAKCAVDGALHDLLGKICGQPLWRILGLDPAPPPTSYTISIDTVEGTARRAAAAASYHALKIKVGGPGDLERVRTVRAQAPDALIRVDANEAWTVHSTVELVPELEALGVELIEQPLPARDHKGYCRLHDSSLSIPIVLDESCHTLPDVPKCGEIADGREHQADEVRRHPRGAAHDPRRPRARAQGDARVHERVVARDRPGGPDLAARRRRRPRRPSAEQNDSHTGLLLVDGRVVPGDGPGLGVTPLEQWP